MFGELVEVAIGVVLVYLLISLMCSAVMEGLAARLHLRAKDLEAGVRNLFDPISKANEDDTGLGAWVKKVNDRLQAISERKPVAGEPQPKGLRKARDTVVMNIAKRWIVLRKWWAGFRTKVAWVTAVIAVLPALVLWAIGGAIWVVTTASWIVRGRSPYGRPPTTGTGAAAEIFNHPLMRTFMKDGRLPSYLPSKVFSAALLDNLAAKAASDSSADAIRARIVRISTAEVRDALKGFLTSGSAEEIEARVTSLPDALRDALIALRADPPGAAAAVDALADTAAADLLASLLTEGVPADVRKRLEAMPMSNFKLDVLALLNQTPVAALIEQLPNDQLKRAFRALLGSVGDDMEKARGEIEQWFDGGMERVSGWYKKRAQVILIVVALPIVIALNADTLTIATNLWQNGALRDSLASLGAETVPPNGETADEAAKRVRTLHESLSTLDLIGWRERSEEYKDPRENPQVDVKLTLSPFHFHLNDIDFIGWLGKALGLAVTLAAVSQGSDIWFQILKRLVNIRSSGKAPPTTTGNTAPSGGTAITT